MKNVSLLYSLTIIFFSILLLDFIYFYFVQESMMKMILVIQKNPVKVNLIYFILCYLFLTSALYYFIIREKKSPIDAFLLGLSIYAIYELTNASLFTNWKLWVVIVDSLWGGVLFSLVTYIYYYLIR
jgi:uncharacterized membrane protein